MGCLWSVALEFKIFKMLSSFLIFKIIEFAAGHFNITTQMRSVRSVDSIIYSITSPLHHFYFIHFACVRYNDPSASAVIIAYITLPLRGNPP
jgi:hypothetical protein